MLNITDQDILEEIEKDKLLLAKESMTLNFLYEDDRPEPTKKDMKQHQKQQRRLQRQQIAKNHYTKFRRTIRKIKSKSDQDLIDGPSYIPELIKVMLTGTGIAFVTGFQGIVPYICYRYMKTEVSQQKRKKLHAELDVELKKVTAQLNDLEKRDDLDEDEKETKYKLVKIKATLEQNLTKLERYIGKQDYSNKNTNNSNY